jgi:type I restriction enzyme S subunit
MSLVGTAGKVLIVPEGAQPGIINPRLIRIRADPTRVSAVFLSHVLRSDITQAKLESLAQGGTMGVLNASTVGSIVVPIPPIAEQQAISEALTAANLLVESLERLIAKKQAIKQGMMQQLLTGKTRLPGFTGEWVPGRLADVLKVRHGRNQREVESPSGKFPILGTGGVIGRTDTPLYSQPSVLIGRKGTIDRPQFRDTPFWTVDTLFYTEVAASSDPRFLYYFFTTVDWRSMNEASGVPSLNSSRIESVKIQIPPLDEQRAIGSALRDLELEVEALEEKLAKSRAIKSGMMQELLTGRTRLLPARESE